jgi:hypothetical protein
MPMKPTGGLSMMENMALAAKEKEEREARRKAMGG